MLAEALPSLAVDHQVGCLHCTCRLPFNRLMMTKFQFPVAKWV